MDDASLDDFLDAGEDASSDDTIEEDDPGEVTRNTTDVEGDPSAADEEPSLDGVEPTTPTMQFGADGGACTDCGERVARRWRDDGEFVCRDCKAW